MNKFSSVCLAVMLSVGAACTPDATTSTGQTGVRTSSYDAVPLIPRDVLFGNPEKAGPQISPDGTKLAYLAPDQGVLNVWVRTIGQTDDKVVTRDRVRGIRSYFWAPSGQHILYVQDKGGDENWHVWATPIAGGESRNLTPLDNVRAQIVAVESSHPNHIMIGLNDRNPQLHDVYKLDLTTGERTLVVKNDIGALGWGIDHTFSVRAAQVLTPTGGSKIIVRQDESSAWKDLVEFPAEDMFTSGMIGFSGDNRSLYLLSSAGTNTTELRSIDIATGKETKLASDPTADITNLMSHPVTYEIQAVGFVRARLEWKALDPAMSEHFSALSSLHDGDFQISSRDDNDGTWLVSYVQDDGPVAYYAYERASKKGTFLFNHRSDLEGLQLSKMKPVSYQARDGLTIHGYLSTPVGVEAKNLPAVVLVHGGPWARDNWRFNPMVQLMTNRGYAVLQPNFRGSTGYGKDFLNAANREWGGKMQDDVTDGTKWLIDQGIADPARICIAGGSYGGYATLMGLAKEPDLYACGVDIVGVANLITWMKTIPPYWMPLLPVLHQRVGNPDTEAEFLKSRSPVFLADKIRAPLLIAQGANDPRVPRDESIQIRDALMKAGHKVEYIEYADEGHGFQRPQNRLDFFAKAEKFIARYLGGRFQD